jgi:hypothetical protein
MASTTPHSLYVTERRKAAATKGAPLLRLAGPAMHRSVAPDGKAGPFDTSMYLKTGVIAVWRSGGKVLACDGRSGMVTITPGLVKEHIEKSGGSIICTDQSSFDSLVRKIEHFGGQVATQLGYQLRAVRRLPASTRVGILTDLLSQKFWMPEGQKPDSIAAWKQALNVTAGGPRGVIEMVKLAGSSEQSIGTAAPLLGKAVAELRKHDKTAWEKAASNSDESAIAGFLAAEKAAEAALALTAFDTIGRHEVATDGSSARIAPFATTANSNVLAEISQPCRIKPGKKVELLSVTTSEKAGTAELVTITYDPSRGLVGEFRPANSSAKDPTENKSFSPLYRAPGEGTEFIMATKPFFGGMATFQGSSGRRWTDPQGPPRPPKRDVPIDVVFAGAITS